MCGCVSVLCQILLTSELLHSECCSPSSLLPSPRPFQPIFCSIWKPLFHCGMESCRLAVCSPLVSKLSSTREPMGMRKESSSSSKASHSCRFLAICVQTSEISRCPCCKVEG